MKRQFSHPIVDEAIRLLREKPELTALDILDRALAGHEGEHPDFSSRDPRTGAHPHPAYDDETDVGTPFAELLRRAFDPDLDPREMLLLRADDDDVDALRARVNNVADRWQRVIDNFALRYQLWA